MHSQSIREAVHVLTTLTAVGCQMHAEGDALYIQAMTNDLRHAMRQLQEASLVVLLCDTLRRLLQVLDMAQPAMPVGVQEDFAPA